MSNGDVEEPDMKSLLLADLEHFGDALLRNEEMGEKRLSFFLTLVTAVIAAVGALLSEKVQTTLNVKELVPGALYALLVVGILTYLRMLQRNAVTDGYIKTMTHIRCEYAKLAGVDGYNPVKHARRVPALLRAGYAQTVAAANGGIVLILAYFVTSSLGAAVTIGLLVTAPLWWFAASLRPPRN